MSTTWGTPETLLDGQVNAYLSRIGLDPAPTRARPADLGLLRDVQVAHVLAVPFDLSSIHLPLNCDETSYRPRGGPGMPLDFVSGYRSIVEQHRGGYCFVLNGLFSALLRSLGFRTSELSARVYPHRNKEPKEAGWTWTPITHMVIVADTANEGRFLVDVGFGGGNCPFPIPLVDNATSTSLTKNESFELRHETLPGADPNAFPDIAPGWTLYRHFATAEDNSVAKISHTSPCYHFTMFTMAANDFAALSYWVSHAPDSPFAKELIVSRPAVDGSRAVLHHTGTDESARFYIRDGLLGKLVHEETVPMTNSVILALCRERFDFH